MVDSNLLITYDSMHKRAAESEVKVVLKKIKARVSFQKSPVDGILFLRVAKPRDAVKKIGVLCKKDKTLLEATHSWTPVDKWVKLSETGTLLKKLEKKMDRKKSWKMDLHKRLNETPSIELIKKFTEYIDIKNVDLEKPAQIIRVDIIKDRAGVSLLSPDEVLNVQKAGK